MQHSSELFVDAPSSTVIDVLSDLSTYPSWNDLVANAEPLEATDDDPGPVWRTTLTAKVGPFARSKQLRFVRDTLVTDHETGVTNIGFSRNELDDRSHASWTMECSVREAEKDGAEGSAVVLSLSYDGGLWIPSLGSVLDSAIERATRRLPAYVKELR